MSEWSVAFGLAFAGRNRSLLSLNERPDEHLLASTPSEDLDRLQLVKALAQAARASCIGHANRNALHGTVLLASDGGGLLVFAERSGGKSTTAAVWDGLLGLPVLTDDLVVLDSSGAFVGPRVLPTRPQTASLMGLVPNGNCIDLANEAPLRAEIHSIYVLRTGSSSGVRELSTSDVRYELSRRAFDDSDANDLLAGPLHKTGAYSLTRDFESRSLDWYAEQIAAIEV